MRTATERGRFFGAAVRRRQVGDLVLVDSRHEAGTRLPRHRHEHAYFCVNHSGTYTEEFGRQRRDCAPGMLVFHPAGEAHCETHHAAPVGALNVEIGQSWLDRILEVAGPLDQPAQFASGEIASAGQQLLREFSRPGVDADLVIEGLCWEILAATIPRSPTAGETSRPRWLAEAQAALEARLAEPLTLRELAGVAGVHPVHFAATFRRFHGCSVGQYLRRLRLRSARAQLADRDRPLAQIATDAGFADQSHFTRCFKRFVGMTPGAYRTLLAFKTR